MSEYDSPMQFIDLSTQQKKIRSEIDAAIKKVLDHGQYIMGPEVKEFEDNLEVFTGSKHAITCANGTDALSLVLMSWGVGKGDAVFIPSFTYVASAEAPALLGATPFFVDVLEDSFNIDPSSFKQAIVDCKELGLNPFAVIPVDLFGQPSDIDSITSIAHNNKIKVLVDAAQSFGASSKNRPIGSMGDATTTSFFPAKPLGCYGDGGAVFTQDDGDAELIRSIRLHGKGLHKYEHIHLGVNSRLDTIQAAILIEKLKILPEEIISRGRVAKLYKESLRDSVKTPSIPETVNSAWAQYTLQINERDKIQASLKSHNIPSIIYYPIPLSEQPGYAHYPSATTGLHISKMLTKTVLSLPMHPYLRADEINYISSTLKESL